MSWDHASEALERLAEETRKADRRELNATGLRQQAEDKWLAEQRELARIPACPCDHPPGWHFSGREILAILLILAVIIGAAMLP